MAKKINFYSSVKMHKACLKDEIRPAMNYIHFKGGFAYATDAHCAIKNYLTDICNLSEEQITLLDGKILHGESYAAMLGCHSIIVQEDGIQCTNAKGIKGAFFAFYSGDELKFPDIDEFIKNAKELEPQEGCENGVTRVAINSEIYRSLIDAFAHKKIIYNFKGDKVPIVCTSDEPRWQNSIAVIMPLAISDYNV